MDVAPENHAANVAIDIEYRAYHLKVSDGHRQFTVGGPFVTIGPLEIQLQPPHVREGMRDALKLAKVEYGVHIPDRRRVVLLERHQAQRGKRQY